MFSSNVNISNNNNEKTLIDTVSSDEMDIDVDYNTKFNIFSNYNKNMSNIFNNTHNNILNKLNLNNNLKLNTIDSNNNISDIEKVSIKEENIEIRNVSKIFSYRKTYRLNENSQDNSYQSYENEIFEILGHNGIGKSKILYFDGEEYLRNNLNIRQKIGICPQNYRVLGEVELIDKRYDIVGILSGGQKKKLNIIIALILGLFSRRKIWDLLKKNKKGKVVFLTMHYMDEAKYDSDTVNITESNNYESNIYAYENIIKERKENKIINSSNTKVILMENEDILTNIERTN
ncbi:hypothetical protein H8356DRAFT_1323680 [Neocallimastix lanati (nom. inval.)]|nr:hypothetical protein H8356DRAFT_1323680 [Neocallimastix sp. JGI-2020a]